MIAAYDVVGFDPRGVASSDPVDCIDDAELDERLRRLRAAEAEHGLDPADRLIMVRLLGTTDDAVEAGGSD